MDHHRWGEIFLAADQYGHPHRYGDQSEKPSDRDRDLGDELADVIWVVACLANQTGIDLTAAIERNFAKKTTRDATRHQNNPKLK